MLLQKPMSFIEVYNDLNGDVVNFFRMMRERGQELANAIQLTPYARAEYEQSWLETNDPLERARRLYVQAWMKRDGYRVSDKSGGWRMHKTNARGSKSCVHDWNNIKHLEAIVKRLKKVALENDKALNIIERYDTSETLFYLDPPYVQSTRESRWAFTAYAYEMSDDDHRGLANALNNIAGMAIISGYPSPLYEKVFADWEMVTKKTSANNQSKTKTEALWLNQAVVKSLSKKSLKQMCF